MFRLIVTVACCLAPVNSLACSAGSQPGTATYAMPHPGPIIRSFGVTRDPVLGINDDHKGIDIAAPKGDPVTPMAPGVVVFSARDGRLGITLIIDHGEGLRSTYGHLGSIEVKQGDCVGKKTIVGRIGATGLVPGPMLHFEVSRNDKPLDPRVLIAGSRR